MMGGAINLGRILGIQFRIHYTWFIIFIFITTSLAWLYFPSAYPGWGQPLYWFIGVTSSLLFFSSVLAHELSHSLVSRRNGIPVKSITLFIFGGVAQISREAEKASAEFKMAAAGPACSLAIGGLFALLWLLTQGVIEPLAAMAFWLAQVNVVLAVFNLIPGFPLDGGRVLRSILWRFSASYQYATRIATRVGQGIGYLFILGGIIIIFSRPLGMSWFDGIWIAFIGWFLQNAAKASYSQSQLRGALRGFTVADFMTRDCLAVKPEVSINLLLQGDVNPGGRSCFMVADEDRLLGMVSLHDNNLLSREDRDTVTVREIMTPINDLPIARLEQDALAVMEQMEQNNINQMPVVSEGRVVGMVYRDSLIRLLRTRGGLDI